MAEDRDFVFKIAEPEGKSIPLRDLATVLTGLDSSLNSSYRAVFNVNRVTPGMRNILDIGITKVERGSIILHLSELVGQTDVDSINAAIAATSQALTDKAPNIFTTFKSAFEFFVAYYGEKSKGNNPEIRVENNSNTVVILNNGGTINVGDIAFKVAGECQPHFQKMAEPIQAGKIKSIECGEHGLSSPSSVTLDFSNSRAFETELNMREDMVEFVGTVLSFDRPRASGRVLVIGESSLPDGVYPFKIQDPVKERLIPAIESLKGDAVKMSGYSQHVKKIAGTDAVFKLYITNLTMAPGHVVPPPPHHKNPKQPPRSKK